MDAKRSRFLRYWDPLVCLALVFTATVTPFELALLQPELWNSLFFINRGVIQITLFERETGETPVRQLCDGGHFGDHALVGGLHLGVRRVHGGGHDHHVAVAEAAQQDQNMDMRICNGSTGIS